MVAALGEEPAGRRPAGTRPEIFVRINPIRSRAGLADLLALTDPAVPTAWDGLLLTKVDHPGDVRQVAEVLDSCGRAGCLGALIETIEGVENAHAIACASPRLAFLMFGGADLSAELGVALAWEPLVPARARVVAAARGRGLDAVEMPWVTLDDEAGYRADLARSFALGFTARAAIHPKQIAAIHEALTPSPEAIAHARRVLAAHAAAGGGACLLDGRLVERPLVLACQRTLALARAAGIPAQDAEGPVCPGMLSVQNS